VSLDDEDGDPVRDGPLDVDGREDGTDPLAQAIDTQAGHRLVAALAGVPAAQRDAFLLHVEAGLSLAEIAGLAGVPAETVKSRLRYAYRRLRAALEDLQ
jgi:RNA polymerase sigma-70 factor (ECF subfamily)